MDLGEQLRFFLHANSGLILFLFLPWLFVLLSPPVRHRYRSPYLHVVGWIGWGYASFSLWLDYLLQSNLRGAFDKTPLDLFLKGGFQAVFWYLFLGCPFGWLITILIKKLRASRPSSPGAPAHS